MSSKPSKSARQRANKLLRFLGGDELFRCRYCDVLLTPESATIDHVIALGRGGKKTEKNEVIACVTCNASKGDKTLEEWLVWLKRVELCVIPTVEGMIKEE